MKGDQTEGAALLQGDILTRLAYYLYDLCAFSNKGNTGTGVAVQQVKPQSMVPTFHIYMPV